jgi:hypothetical protein
MTRGEYEGRIAELGAALLCLLTAHERAAVIKRAGLRVTPKDLHGLKSTHRSLSAAWTARSRTGASIESERSGTERGMDARAAIGGNAKPEAYLAAWHLLRTDVGSQHLVGAVFGHIRFPEGALVATSDLLDMHLVPNRRICVETVNTLYTLGHPAPDNLSEDYRELVDEVLGARWESISLCEGMRLVTRHCGSAAPENDVSWSAPIFVAIDPGTIKRQGRSSQSFNPRRNVMSRKKKKRMRVRVHPEAMADIARMPPKEQEEIMEIIRAFHKAAGMTDANAGEEVFEANLTKLLAADADCGALDDTELDEKQKDELQRLLLERLRNEPKFQQHRASDDVLGPPWDFDQTWGGLISLPGAGIRS